jgi:hypothetical protein
MAPWSFFQSQASELPAAAAPNSGDAFEVFIGGALAKIYHEANGRSKEHRAIREACKRILGASVAAPCALKHGTAWQSAVSRRSVEGSRAVSRPGSLTTATGIDGWFWVAPSAESLRAEEAAGRGKVVTPLEHATCAAVRT